MSHQRLSKMTILPFTLLLELVLPSYGKGEDHIYCILYNNHIMIITKKTNYKLYDNKSKHELKKTF